MKTRSYSLPLVTSVVLALAFPSLSAWPLAYVGLVPLLLWLRGKSYRQAFLGGTFAGLVFYLITFAWFASLTYWVGGIVLLGVGFLFVFFALFWGALAMGYLLVSERSPIAVVVAFPAMWVLMEYVHNHIFTGFGWGSLGYTQWNNLPVAQLASLGSMYAVSFYLVAINVLACMLVRHIKRPARSIIVGSIIAVLAVAVLLWGRMRMQPPDMSLSLRVGVVQPNFSLDVKWSAEYSEHMLQTQKWLTDVAAAKGAELVVWPESSLYGFLVEEIPEIAGITRSHNIYLLTGSNHYERPHASDEDGEVVYLNSAFLVNPEGNILGRYDKQHLAPFGEYVPFGKVFPFIDKVVPQVADFTPGVLDTLFEMEGRKFAVLICFENSFPHHVRAAARRGADFLVQLTNDGWFGHTAQPKQDLAIAVFRAIENGMTLVRGTNTGISCFVDPWGRVKGVVGESWGETVFVRGLSVETITTRPHSTLYRTCGDVWILGCLVITVVAVGVCLRRPGASADCD